MDLRLDSKSNADMMSDMKVFTVRDLDRRPGEVLAACDADGEAHIHCRDGRVYTIKPEKAPRRKMGLLPDFEGRRRKLFPEPLPASLFFELDRFIRGE